MALIACRECKQQVSEKAPACPKCGAPIAAHTIEATGKKWKAMQLFGAVAFLLGIFGFCSAAMQPEPSGSTGAVMVLMVLGGLVLTIGARVGAWWNHG